MPHNTNGDLTLQQFTQIYGGRIEPDGSVHWMGTGPQSTPLPLTPKTKTSMTPKEINAAIMESQGFTIHDGCAQKPGIRGMFAITDYYNDLNAIAEAVKNVDQTLFAINLFQTVVPSKDWGTLILTVEASSILINATAQQRCEAYLKTIGKWRGE